MQCILTTKCLFIYTIKQPIIQALHGSDGTTRKSTELAFDGTGTGTELQLTEPVRNLEVTVCTNVPVPYRSVPFVRYGTELMPCAINNN